MSVRNLVIRAGLVVAAAAMMSSVSLGVAWAAKDRLLYSCKDIEKKSPLSFLSRKLYQGKDGWFIRAIELDSIYEYPPDTMNALARINEALHYRGVKLILVPVISKAILGKDFLPDGGVFVDRLYDPDFAAAQFDDLALELRNAGITVINTNDDLKKHPEFDLDSFYFKRDIHWTPEGAKFVAEAVAKTIRAFGPAGVDAVTFETTKLQEKRRLDSRLNRALNHLCDDKVPSELTSVYETKRQVDSLDDIFVDDTAATEPVRDLVHVVGTSFTDDLLVFNFNGFLRQALGADVQGFSVPGGQAVQSIYGWANSEIGIGRKPSFLVWEYNQIPELITLTPYLANVLVPAIVGDCSAENELKAMSFANTSEINMEFGDSVMPDQQVYARYIFDNTSLRQFRVNVTFSDGTTKLETVKNPSRVQDIEEFSYQVPYGSAATPKSLKLEIIDGQNSSGKVKLCRYPKGIFSESATSN
jgi:hypothetical protein